jgi:hypothetical protein
MWWDFAARRICGKQNFKISGRIKFIAQREILPGKNLCPIPAPINKSANKSREATIYKMINLQCSDWV